MTWMDEPSRYERDSGKCNDTLLIGHQGHSVRLSAISFTWYETLILSNSRGWLFVLLVPSYDFIVWASHFLLAAQLSTWTECILGVWWVMYKTKNMHDVDYFGLYSMQVITGIDPCSTLIVQLGLSIVIEHIPSSTIYSLSDSESSVSRFYMLGKRYLKRTLLLPHIAHVAVWCV